MFRSHSYRRVLSEKPQVKLDMVSNIFTEHWLLFDRWSLIYLIDYHFNDNDLHNLFSNPDSFDINKIPRGHVWFPHEGYT